MRWLHPEQRALCTVWHLCTRFGSCLLSQSLSVRCGCFPRFRSPIKFNACSHKLGRDQVIGPAQSMLPQFAMQQQLYRRVHSRRPFTGVRNREAGCTRVAPRPATAVQQASPIAAAEQLQRWLSKTTATGKVSIAPDAGGLPRLVASKDLQAGEAVLSVPDSAWLSTQAVKKHPLGAALDGLEPWLQLALILVSERFGSSSSPQGSAWAAYVAALPQPAISPLMWTEQELALVQGTQLLQSLQSYK